MPLNLELLSKHSFTISDNKKSQIKEAIIDYQAGNLSSKKPRNKKLMSSDHNLFFKTDNTGQTHCYVMGPVMGMGGYGTLYYSQGFSLENGELKENPKSLVIKKVLLQPKDKTLITDKENNRRRRAIRDMQSSDPVLESYIQPNALEKEKDTAAQFGQLEAAIQHKSKMGIEKEYLIQEFIAGVQLFKVIQENTLSLKEKEELTYEILRSMNAIHAQKVVHNDIKPENILIRKEQGKFVVTIIDFGLSQRNQTTIPRHGTIGYSAPERLDYHPELENTLAIGTAHPGTYRSDSFSIGQLLIELWRDPSVDKNFPQEDQRFNFYQDILEDINNPKAKKKQELKESNSYDYMKKKCAPYYFERALPSEIATLLQGLTVFDSKLRNTCNQALKRLSSSLPEISSSSSVSSRHKTPSPSSDNSGSSSSLLFSPKPPLQPRASTTRIATASSSTSVLYNAGPSKTSSAFASRTPLPSIGSDKQPVPSEQPAYTPHKVASANASKDDKTNAKLSNTSSVSTANSTALPKLRTPHPPTTPKDSKK